MFRPSILKQTTNLLFSTKPLSTTTSLRYFSSTNTIKMPVKPIKNLSEFQSAIAFEGLTVVDFYAVWCGPCKMISPVLEKLSNNYTQAQFLKVDVDEAADVAQEYAVAAMPTFIFFKNGQKVETIVGANPQKLQAFIAQNA